MERFNKHETFSKPLLVRVEVPRTQREKEREVFLCPPALPTAAQQQQVVLRVSGLKHQKYQTAFLTSMGDSWMCGKKNQKRKRNTGGRKNKN